MLYPAGVVRIEHYLQMPSNYCLKGAQAMDLQAANCKQSPSAGELLLELKALRVT